MLSRRREGPLHASIASRAQKQASQSRFGRNPIRWHEGMLRVINSLSVSELTLHSVPCAIELFGTELRTAGYFRVGTLLCMLPTSYEHISDACPDHSTRIVRCLHFPRTANVVKFLECSVAYKIRSVRAGFRRAGRRSRQPRSRHAWIRDRPIRRRVVPVSPIGAGWAAR